MGLLPVQQLWRACRSSCLHSLSIQDNMPSCAVAVHWLLWWQVLGYGACAFCFSPAMSGIPEIKVASFTRNAVQPGMQARRVITTSREGFVACLGAE